MGRSDAAERSSDAARGGTVKYGIPGFRKLSIIVLYKLKMMFCDRLFFAAMVIIPLLITIATGYALRYEKRNIIPIAIVDEDSSDYSGTLIRRMYTKEGLEIDVTSMDRAMDMIRGNAVETVFVIKKGFEEKLRKGDNRRTIESIRSPSSFSAGFVEEVMAGEVIKFTTRQMAVDWVGTQYGNMKTGVPDKTAETPGPDKSAKTSGPDIPAETPGRFKSAEILEKEVSRYYDALWNAEPEVTVRFLAVEGGKEERTDAANASIRVAAGSATSGGMITAFIMFFILFSSGWLIEERRNGTLQRLAAGPDALGCSYAGSVIALFAAGAIQVVLFAGIARVVSGVALLPDGWSYLIMCLYILAVISISMLLSALLKTPSQLQAGAPVFALMTGFAGGCFWNFTDLSKEAKFISMLTPQGWALDGINKLLREPGGVGQVFASIAVLLGISAILLPLSLKIIKKGTNQ